MWNPELVQRLEAFEDKIMHAIDHCLDQVIGGFVTEFTVDILVSYDEAERRFLKGPRGKYVRSLNILIKMLLCEKWVMPLP